MSKGVRLASIVSLFILSVGAFASTGTTMLAAPQDSAPAKLVQTTHGIPDLLTAAKFLNQSGKSITSYRIGWAYVLPTKVEFHSGAVMKVPAGIHSGLVQEVPDQAVSMNAAANKVIFFISELTFADGSHWKASHREIQGMTSKSNAEPK